MSFAVALSEKYPTLPRPALGRAVVQRADLPTGYQMPKEDVLKRRLIVGNWPDDAPSVAIIGDTLFAGSLARGIQSTELLKEKVREQIFSLPPETLLCPGHGPLTTVSEEKALKGPSYASWCRSNASVSSLSDALLAQASSR